MNQQIKFAIFDVDGTLTDGGMYYSESGDEFKRFNTKDGMGMKRLTATGFPLGILSSGLGKQMAQRRAAMLNVQYVHVGPEPKMEILEQWRAELGLELSEIAFIGDDINDAEVMAAVGFSACPSDAHPEIIKIASVVLEKAGGEGCAREFIDRFILPNL